MAKLKYINFQNLGLVIFEEHIDHSEMAHKLSDKPISAGFVQFPNKDECGNEAHCFGESVSLGIKSSEEDTKLLQRRLNPYS